MQVSGARHFCHFGQYGCLLFQMIARKILLKWFPQAGVEQLPPFRSLLGMIHFECTLAPQMKRVIHLHDKSSATCRCPHRSGVINGRKYGIKQTLYNCGT